MVYQVKKPIQGYKNTMDVAILQTRFYTGGKSRVAAEFVRVLNEIDLKPTLISFSSDTEIGEFESNYGLSAGSDFTIEPLLGSWFMRRWKRGVSYQSPLLNILAKNKLSKFDLIINSNNCMYFLPKNSDIIHYVHHPPEAVLKYEPKYNSNKIWKMYTSPLKKLYGFQPSKVSNVVIANSHYTKGRIEEFYDVEEEVRVVYPPVIDDFYEIDRSKIIRNKVTSLGAIHPNKDQLSQITIAKEHPDCQFILMGRIKSQRYYQKCKDKISKNNVTNVKLSPNVDNSTLLKHLDEAEFFIHTRPNERFGIAVVEAIANGCIPLVHNSGGLKEMVPMDDLRFDSAEELTEKLTTMKTTEFERKQALHQKLIDDFKKFSNDRFRNNLREIMERENII